MLVIYIYIIYIGCVNICDTGLQAILQNNPNLLTLNIISCINITNKSMSIIINCIILQSLNCSKCYKITDKSIILLATKCNKLQALNIAGIYIKQYIINFIYVFIIVIDQNCNICYINEFKNINVYMYIFVSVF